jgi:hypothetical protein
MENKGMWIERRNMQKGKGKKTKTSWKWKIKEDDIRKSRRTRKEGGNMKEING